MENASWPVRKSRRIFVFGRSQCVCSTNRSLLGSKPREHASHAEGLQPLGERYDDVPFLDSRRSGLGERRALVGVTGMGEQAIKWYGDNCAVYPLKDESRKPNIINASGLSADTTHPNDFQYFINLDKMIQYEPT